MMLRPHALTSLERNWINHPEMFHLQELIRDCLRDGVAPSFSRGLSAWQLCHLWKWAIPGELSSFCQIQWQSYWYSPFLDRAICLRQWLLEVVGLHQGHTPWKRVLSPDF